jgi:hypothetical protein
MAAIQGGPVLGIAENLTPTTTYPLTMRVRPEIGIALGNRFTPAGATISTLPAGVVRLDCEDPAHAIVAATILSLTGRGT